MLRPLSSLQFVPRNVSAVLLAGASALATALGLVACSRSPAPLGEAATAASLSDDGCNASWRALPATDLAIAVPDGGALLLHAAARGTQNYACTPLVDGGTQWTPVGPSATLTDCKGAVIGRHFANDAGSPEWQTSDGTYVVARKVASEAAKNAQPAVPWLLLQAIDKAGPGPLGKTAWVQRTGTNGGAAAARTCSPGERIEVPYGADYYFFAP